MDLSIKIKNIRTEMGLNMREFGTWLGVSESMVSKLESGKRSLSPKILKKLDLNPIVAIPREWLMRLIQLHNLYQQAQGDEKTTQLNQLLGYIESAKLLNLNS